MATLEINWDSLEDGDGSARWGDLTDEQLDAVMEAAESVLGKPDTLA